MIQWWGDWGGCVQGHFSWIIASEPRISTYKHGSRSNGDTPKFGLKAAVEGKVARLLEIFYAEKQERDLRKQIDAQKAVDLELQVVPPGEALKYHQKNFKKSHR